MDNREDRIDPAFDKTCSGLMNRITRTCTTGLFRELLHHGPSTDLELQFMSLESWGSDPPESEMLHWHRAHVEGWWYKWEEVVERR